MPVVRLSDVACGKKHTVRVSIDTEDGSVKFRWFSFEITAGIATYVSSKILGQILVHENIIDPEDRGSIFTVPPSANICVTTEIHGKDLGGAGDIDSGVKWTLREIYSRD